MAKSIKVRGKRKRPTHRSTWKAVERLVAKFFHTVRNPLSGGNSKHSRSDTLHERLFIEVKMVGANNSSKGINSLYSLFDETGVLADREGKTPILALKRKGSPGFLIVCHSSDFTQVAAER